MRPLLRFLFWTAVAVGSVVGILRLVALRWWTVPENDPWLEASVAPTLRGGDTVLLWRATRPVLGDLVACPEPGAADHMIMGRIVGESGDKVTMTRRAALVNGKPERSERRCPEETFEVADPRTGETVEERCQIVELAGTLHMQGDAANAALPPLDQEFEVPEGDVFLVSDNRLFPYDSRDFGTAPRSTCRESVMFRLWSKAGLRDEENRFTFVQ
jgi:signal peptidase I